MEDELLEKIERGHLHVCHQTGVVSYWHRGRMRWYEKKPRQHEKSGRWKFAFKIGPNKSTSVYRNRLVWMYFNRRPIPQGYVVNHVDGDNQNDHPSNLSLMRKVDSDRQGNQMQCGGELDDWIAFLDFWVEPSKVRVKRPRAPYQTAEKGSCGGSNSNGVYLEGRAGKLRTGLVGV